MKNKVELILEIKNEKDIEYLFFKIKNNGYAFPNNFNKENFIEKYRTSDKTKDSGIGGYDINRIATYFGNFDWKLFLNQDKSYPVEFEFKFKINYLNKKHYGK